MRPRLVLPRAPLAILALLVLACGAASAQETAPVLVERTDEGDLVAREDEPAIALFTLFNLNPTEDFYVSVAVSAPRDWDTSVQPDGFFLGPRNQTVIEVAIAPDGIPRMEGVIDVTFSLVDGRTGRVTKITERIEVLSGAPPRVLGFFPNPLPAPLDNAYGTFLLDMAVWAGVAVASIFVGDAVVRAATTRAPNFVTREILGKLRQPLFYFVLLLGLSSALASLPRNPFVVFVERTLVAIGVGVFGLYVVYRALDSALFYYQKEVAPRTNTAVDDVLVPIARKVGIVVLWVAGIVITLRRLGWDPTLVFAGAGIAGLVIAFAAQDTISNLFSGVFILLDQPFKEGDDIQLETGEIVRVTNIGLRTTRLYHGRNHEQITIPNNQLASRRVINLAGPDHKYWVIIEVGASYGSDPARVREVLRDTALAHPKVLREGDFAPLVLFTRFGESSLDFMLRAAIGDYRERGVVGTELRIMIKKAFDEAGIEIPFPQRTLWLKEAPPLTVREGRQA